MIRTSSSSKSDLHFDYDAMGQRICKIVKPRDPAIGLSDQNAWTYTYYLRDAQGNVIATYDRDFTSPATYYYDQLTVKENHLYGSSRVGVKSDTLRIASVKYNYSSTSNHVYSGTVNSRTSVAAQTNAFVHAIGRRSYELVNHLGNVLVTVSDARTAINGAGAQSGIVVSFNTVVNSATDYYAFGSPMEGRSYSSSNYRYGFNNQEQDNEIMNGVLSFDYRVENPQLARFLSIDPLNLKYPSSSQYSFAENMPIIGPDLEGLEQPNNPNANTQKPPLAPVAVFVQVGVTGVLGFIPIGDIPVGAATSGSIGVMLDGQWNLVIYNTFGGGVGVGDGFSAGVSYGGYINVNSYQDLMGTGGAVGVFTETKGAEGDVSPKDGPFNYAVGGSYGPQKWGTTLGVAGYGEVTTTHPMAVFNLSTASGEADALAFLTNNLGISNDAAVSVINNLKTNLSAMVTVATKIEEVQKTVVTGPTSSPTSNQQPTGNDGNPNSTSNSPPTFSASAAGKTQGKVTPAKSSQNVKGASAPPPSTNSNSRYAAGYKVPLN